VFSFTREQAEACLIQHIPFQSAVSSLPSLSFTLMISFRFSHPKPFLILIPALGILCAAQAQNDTARPNKKPSTSEVKDLPEVIITADPAQYTSPTASGSTTRSEIPLKRLPQSAQVITRTLIDHQLIQDPGVLVRNFSGIGGFDTREINNMVGFTIRGFQSYPYLDGFQLYYPGPANETLVNTERVEVVKGPTGTLFGGAAGGPIGGLVNYVSKRPQKEASYMVGMNAGSWGAYGNIWDINQPLDKNGRVLFRITGDIRETRDVNPFIKGHLTSFFPTLAVSLTDDTTLTLRARYSDRSQTDYSGLPAAGTVNLSGITLDRYTIFRAENQPATTARNRAISAELKHDFNSDWNFVLEASYSDMNFDQYSTWANTFFGPIGTTYFVNMATLLQNMHSLAFNARVNGKFETGPLKHTLTVGMDFDQTTDNAALLFNIGAGVLDVSNPVYPNFVPGGFPFGLQENDYQTLAFFLQDQVTIAERVHLLGSLRYSRFNVHDVDPANGVDSDTTDYRFTGRLGLSVDVTDWMTAFGGWGQGFQAPIGVPIVGGKKLIEGEQWEVGLKFQLADTLQASVSWFHNERTNMPVPSGIGFTNVQSGVQRAKGFEADLIWQPTREFSMLLNYAYQDAEVISSTAVPNGSRLPRVPAHSGRAALRYDFRDGFFKGFGAGMGVMLASARAGDPGNTFYTPSYATVDAQFSYTRGPATFSVGIQNLLDARYYETYAFLNGAVSPNAPFNLFCQATLRF